MKPDPQEFARILLWNVSALRAEVASVRAQLDVVLDALDKAPSEADRQECEKKVRKKQKFLFSTACNQAGLNPTPPDEPQDIDPFGPDNHP